MTLTSQQPQTVPLQVHQADERLVLAAPMPGLEPQDISVIISGNRVTIRGEYRGSRQDQPEILISEWTIGPYDREVVLPQPVDGALTNATYGNGVLVLVMPKVESVQPEATFQLQAVGAPVHGERVGHSGSTITPITTEEHQHKHEAESRRCG